MASPQRTDSAPSASISVCTIAFMVCSAIRALLSVTHRVVDPPQYVVTRRHRFIQWLRAAKTEIARVHACAIGRIVEGRDRITFLPGAIDHAMQRRAETIIRP